MPVFIDSGDNADWIKTGTWDLPTDADAFLRVVEPMGLQHFLTLPAAKSMPASLRTALKRRRLI